MDLQARVNQLLKRYSAEKYEQNNQSFYIYKKRKSLSKSMLSSQIPLVLIEAIGEICEDTGLTKSSVIEHLIYIGLINTEFKIKE